MGEFWQQLLWVFTPLVAILIVAFLVEFYVSLNFVLQWRRWMTASYTSRWLLHSMHYKMALRGGLTDNPDQRISEDVGGFISGAGGVGAYANAGIYNYTIQAMTTATNLVAFSIILWGISRNMDICGVRRADSRISVLGRDPLRLLRHRHDATHRPHPVAAHVPPAGGRGELPFRPRAHPRVQRADRPAQGRTAGDRPRRPRVQRRLSHRPADHPRADDAQLVPAILYPDLGDHSLCGGRAFLFRGEEGRLRHVQPGGRRVRQRQHRDELLRRPLHRSRQLQRDDPAPDLVRGGLRPHARRGSRDAAHRHRAPRARSCRFPTSIWPCPTGASSPTSAISRSFRRIRRWSSVRRASASRRFSAPSPACGRSARAKFCSRPTPS